MGQRLARVPRGLNVGSERKSPDHPVLPTENAATWVLNDARTGESLGVPGADGVVTFSFPIEKFSTRWIHATWGARTYSVGFQDAKGRPAGRKPFMIRKDAEQVEESTAEVLPVPTGMEQTLSLVERLKGMVTAEANAQLAMQREFVSGQNQLFREMVAAISGQAKIATERPAVPPEVVAAFQQIGEAITKIQSELAELRAEGPGDEDDEEDDVEGEDEDAGEAVLAVAKHLGVPAAMVRPYAAQIESIGKEGFMKLFSWIQAQPVPAPPVQQPTNAPPS